MRRPQRRLHVLMWLAVAPAAIAGVYLALNNAPAVPAEPIADVIVTDTEQP